jgi:hypothetical protein
VSTPNADQINRKPSRAPEISSNTFLLRRIIEDDGHQFETDGKTMLSKAGKSVKTFFVSSNLKSLVLAPTHIDSITSTLFQRLLKTAQEWSPTMVGSGTVVDDLRFLPIEPTKRNAELLYCCKLYGQRTNLCCVDNSVQFTKL